MSLKCKRGRFSFHRRSRHARIELPCPNRRGFFFVLLNYFSYIYRYKNVVWSTYTLKSLGMEIGKEKYSKGELAQLARRRMIQKPHDDKNRYTRKIKHKNKSYD